MILPPCRFFYDYDLNIKGFCLLGRNANTLPLFVLRGNENTLLYLVARGNENTLLALLFFTFGRLNWKTGNSFERVTLLVDYSGLNKPNRGRLGSCGPSRSGRCNWVASSSAYKKVLLLQALYRYMIKEQPNSTQPILPA